jgi:molybdate transport system ATP-binding protein
VLDYVEQVLGEWRIPTLYVSHNPEDVQRLAERVLRLTDGRVVATGTPAEVLARAGSSA